MSDEILGQEEREQFQELLRKWNRRCRRALIANNRATDRTVLLERWIGAPASLLAAVVATGVFATVSEDPSVEWRIATGLVALVSAVLAALQTFLNLAEKAEKYRAAARRYAEQRRRIEELLVAFPQSRSQAAAALSEIRASFDAAAAENPNVPHRIWRKADALVAGEGSG